MLTMKEVTRGRFQVEDDGRVVLTFGPELMRRIRSQADEQMRSVENYVTWAIHRALVQDEQLPPGARVELPVREGACNSPQVQMLPDGRMDRHSAALYLGHAPKTLAQWASQGKGPKFIKRGRVWYYQRDLDEWLKVN